MNQDYLAYKSFQVNQLYQKSLNILEIVCPECDNSDIYAVISYAPRLRVAKRQVDVLRSGKRNIIDCGFVAL